MSNFVHTIAVTNTVLLPTKMNFRCHY